MPPARLHPRELDRLLALARLGVLDTEREERYDRITRLAAMVLEVPSAYISLVDADRQWFKSTVGCAESETPRDESFCAHAILGEADLLEVPDATRDRRFHDHPAVVDRSGVRFYAGQVLHSVDGLPLGTLCVVDHRPRTLTTAQRATLADLAAMVEAELQREASDHLLARLHESEGALASILQNLTEGVLLHGADGALLQWNAAAERLLGIDPSGRSTWQLLTSEGAPLRPADHPSIVALQTRSPVLGLPIGIRRPEGDVLRLRANAQPIEGPDGEQQVLTVFVDETDRHALEDALRSSELSARASLDSLEQGVILLAPTGEVLRCNPAAEQLLGGAAADLSDAWRSGRWRPTDGRGQPLSIDELPLVRARRGEVVRGETVTWTRPDGEELRFRLSITPDADGRGNILATFTDVTAEQRMIEDLERFAILFEHANDLITVIDDDGHVIYSSPSYGRVLGYPVGWRHPDGVWGMLHPDDLGPASDELRALVEGARGPEPFTARVRSHAGDWRHLEFVGVDLLDHPAVGGIVLTGRDTTDRDLLAAELAHLASHDSLSGLHNRSVLEPELTRALARAGRLGTEVAVCFIDLDRFKAINDRFGHAVGDDVIVEVGRRLQGAVRAGDLVLRIGGDEFLVVLDPVRSRRDADEAAGRIHRALTGEPIARGDVVVGASMGVALAEVGEEPSSLLQRADAALYVAKARGDSSMQWAGALGEVDLSGLEARAGA